MTMRWLAVVLLASTALACEGLEITLDAPALGNAGSAGTRAGDGDGNANGGSSGDENGGVPAAGAAGAGGLPALVCTGDNWTAEEMVCDKDGPPAVCKGTDVDWRGCRGTGCGVCEELVADYPHYFDRHPCCERKNDCGGKRYACNVACPAPNEFDKIPLCPSE